MQVTGIWERLNYRCRVDGMADFKQQIEQQN
jgi:hypothetical protein